MIKPEPNTAMQNANFAEKVIMAFTSSEDYEKAFWKYFESNYDSLIDEYWPYDSE